MRRSPTRGPQVSVGAITGASCAAWDKSQPPASSAESTAHYLGCGREFSGLWPGRPARRRRAFAPVGAWQSIARINHRLGHELLGPSPSLRGTSPCTSSRKDVSPDSNDPGQHVLSPRRGALRMPSRRKTPRFRVLLASLVRGLRKHQTAN